MACGDIVGVRVVGSALPLLKNGAVVSTVTDIDVLTGALAAIGAFNWSASGAVVLDDYQTVAAA